jgi:Family of unknown function (DUF5455)
MPLLATIIIQMFDFLLGFFARFMVMEKAARFAAATVVLTLIGALFTSAMSCVNGACASTISGMSSVHEGFAMGLRIAINPATLTCVSCYMAVWILCQVYVVKKKAMKFLVWGG